MHKTERKNIVDSLMNFAFRKGLKKYSVEELVFDGEVLSFKDQLSVISHFVHLQDTDFVNNYRDKAQSVLEFWNAYINQEPANAAKTGFVNDFEAAQTYLFNDLFNIPFPAPENPRFTFIDLFAGMGGFRLAMQAQGGKCVFSSEWNEYSKKTYFANFGELPFGDITQKTTKSYIPQQFDVLCAGFPCQPFSIAGVSKKQSLGREHGFLDKTQGTLFFDVAEIIEHHKPKVFFLENVKNLVSHDKGNTFKIIKGCLEELGYSLHYKVMDGKAFVPQHRERIMLIGFRKDLYCQQETFVFPELQDGLMKIRDILEPEVEAKYTLTDNLWTYLRNYAAKHKAAGNGFGYGMTDLNGISRTLSARYYKDGSEILIPQGLGKNPRRLTPRECARLMGYEDRYIINAVSELQAYRQCGNSVIVPLITAVASNLINSMLIDQVYE